ncbi:hypothetical protein L5515_006358 [Caenorhabditis briggsae]|uniref:Peptidase C1A papain C-terminal domain-containing protein n=1 Tax=Caenorhabditis briggsae TaxID=6238 RepID=A0AAE9JJE8_CAEBR|nr:hypothetical protein L5515_006358 [Caenorhabditis briggsae]
MMKILVLAVLLEATSAFVPINPETLTGQALVNYVNSAQSMFTAEYSNVTEEFKKFRVMDVKYAAPHSPELRASQVNTVLPSIPTYFDARTRWPNCRSIKMIRNQATCGSCWAFGAAEVMSDRICIASMGTKQPIISPTDLLSCCGNFCGYGCKGASPLQAFRWWNKKGVVTGGDYRGSGCKPYPFASCTALPCTKSETPRCSLNCQPAYSKAYSKDKYFGTPAYIVDMDVAAIQTEIMTNGPVEAAFIVYDDFNHYRSGVYRHVAGKLIGGHAVKIIGWGIQNGAPYWLMANSWGPYWGENGFFKMLRGVDECGIESTIVAGKPDCGCN